MGTEVLVTSDFAVWYEALSERAQESVVRVVSLLEEHGAVLGFPQSSAIGSSRIALRELRIQHRGKPLRILYIFDPSRRAVLLVGGSKAGTGNAWYSAAIRLAERLYAEYLKEIEDGA